MTDKPRVEPSVNGYRDLNKQLERECRHRPRVEPSVSEPARCACAEIRDAMYDGCPNPEGWEEWRQVHKHYPGCLLSPPVEPVIAPELTPEPPDDKWAREAAEQEDGANVCIGAPQGVGKLSPEPEGARLKPCLAVEGVGQTAREQLVREYLSKNFKPELLDEWPPLPRIVAELLERETLTLRAELQQAQERIAELEELLTRRWSRPDIVKLLNAEMIKANTELRSRLQEAEKLEREACAKIAEGYATLHIESHPCHVQAKKTAAKIRART